MIQEKAGDYLLKKWNCNNLTAKVNHTENKSIKIACYSCMAAITLLIIMEVLLYKRFSHSGKERSHWILFQMGMNALMIGSILLLSYYRKAGLWIYLGLVILFFATTFSAGKGDSTLGLLTPIYFIVYSIVFITLGNEYKKMS